MANVVYIHGAFATPVSFTRLVENLPGHFAYYPQYTVDEELQKNIDRIAKEVAKLDDPIIVGHSLGGVIGLSIANQIPDVKKVITIASPLGGSRTADIMKWFSTQNLFYDISTSSPVIKGLENRKNPCPVYSIVTTAGNNPMILEPNDGVVSIASQTKLSDVQYIKMHFNHLEILMTDELTDVIHDLIF